VPAVQVDDLLELSETVAPCFPPSYDVLNFFIRRYQHFLAMQLLEATAEPDRLRCSAPLRVRAHARCTVRHSKQTLLKCAEWVLWYNGRIARITNKCARANRAVHRCGLTRDGRDRVPDHFDKILDELMRYAGGCVRACGRAARGGAKAELNLLAGCAGPAQALPGADSAAGVQPRRHHPAAGAGPAAAEGQVPAAVASPLRRTLTAGPVG
jgi:hypothetical protein